MDFDVAMRPTERECEDLGAFLADVFTSSIQTQPAIVLATHDFQAPGFYERLGFERKFSIEGRPRGPVDIIYAKRLRDQPGA